MLNFDKVKETDKEVYDLIMAEYDRQNNGLELIASENEPSEAVLQAQSSYHTLKYAEGYPEARYYGGCEVIDATEQLAINRACKLFNCKYANVQPHSGAQANMAVQFALCKAGDTIMGMSLNSGGHLTHGARPTFSGKIFHSVQYEVNEETYEIDYEELSKQIYATRPRLFIAGASAYPRHIDFRRISEIIKGYNRQLYVSLYNGYKDSEDYNHLEEDFEKIKCYFMVDMAHIAGLVAADLHQSPVPYADVVTSTTHKTLRGPRGGLILTNNEELIKRINKAVFPGIQGGPLENIIAAKAVCFGEALKPEFKEYMQKVIDNTKQLASSLMALGVKVLTGGTDNHLLLIDLREENITGQELEHRLEEIGIITNKNAVPFDTKNKKETSGLRIGAAAVTSRGLGWSEMMVIAEIIADCIDDENYETCKESMKTTVKLICAKYPLYQD
jgi:glycine hydroxymethyltransferase